MRSDDRFASGHRLRRFYNWLNDFGGVSEVYYEISGIPAGSGARNRSVASNEVQIQLKGILSMFCACYRIPMTGMHNATLKKSFTGYGRADKEDMCRFAHNLGWPGGVPGTAMDHDAADAIALIVCIEKENGNAVRFAK